MTRHPKKDRPSPLFPLHSRPWFWPPLRPGGGPPFHPRRPAPRPPPPRAPPNMPAPASPVPGSPAPASPGVPPAEEVPELVGSGGAAPAPAPGAGGTAPGTDTGPHSEDESAAPGTGGEAS